MPTMEYTRTGGQRLTYTIVYDAGEYFIQREGRIKKSVPDPLSAGMAPAEATPKMMLRLAIGDIEALNGMDE